MALVRNVRCRTGADGVAAEKSPPAKAQSSASDERGKGADATKPDAAAQHRSEEEYYELYRSLADTLDQVERNYVKPSIAAS